MVTTYTVDPGGKLKAALKAASDSVDDLTVPFTLITRNWYQSNKAIFSLKGPGKYPPLGGFNPNAVTKSGKTRRQVAEANKKARFGFDYPLLVATGRLMSSMTGADSLESIHLVINKKTLLLGTSVPYGVYHQSLDERKKLPFRPFMFIGGEQTAPNDEINNRQLAWTKIIQDFVEQKLRQI